MNFLFSDRRLGAKLAIAAGLLVIGFSVSNLRGDSLRPALIVCQLHPEAFHGRRVWIPAAVVERVAADHFEIAAAKTRAWVEGSIPGLKERDVIALVATFDRRNVLRLDADSRWRRPGLADGAMARLAGSVGVTRLMYGASALVLLWIAWLFFREFQARPAAPAFVARGKPERDG